TPPHPSEADRAARYRIAVPVFQATWLREMRASKRSSEPLQVHLKLDTGMGRIGLRRSRLGCARATSRWRGSIRIWRRPISRTTAIIGISWVDSRRCG
ncbi:alanine racemase, partial [Paenibacillus sp. 598K]|uniref:alanine racemase n=1 Tax=Paenibacillus sp. 598K TaxID=1117987 RepID=UPI001626C254